MTVVQAVNMTRGCRNICLGHIDETHYVSTIENRGCEFGKNWSGEKSVEEKVINKNEKRRAYMKEYMGKRRSDAEFRKKENERDLERRYKNTEITRAKKKEAKKKVKW